MSETATIEQPQVQQPPPTATPVAEQADRFAEDFLGGGDLMRKLSPREPQRPQAPPTPPQEQAPKAPQAQAPQQPAAQEPPKAPEPTPALEVVDERTAALRALGGIVRGEAQPVPDELPEPVKEWATSRGYKPEDVLRIDALHQQIKEGEKYKSESEQLRGLLEALPPDFRIAIDRAVRGENWREPLLSSHDDVDFSKPFDKQDTAVMLSKFAAGKVDQETIDAAKDGDENAKRTLGLATEIARTKYEQIQQQQQNHFRLRQEQDQLAQKQYEQSLNASIYELQRLDPKVAAIVPEIRQGLTREGIMGLFFDEKGMLRQEAARMYAVAKYQSELFDSKVRQVAKEAKDKAELDMINRTTERPTTPARTEQRTAPPPDKAKLADASMDAWLSGADIMGNNR